MTRRRLPLAAALAAVAVAAGCVTPKQKDYTKFVAAQPRSILVIPVMNKSVSLTASDYFLTTIPVPLAERGYYVFPVNLVKRLLEDEGLSDPGLVHNADTMRLAGIFGADAVLYITIEQWDAKYMLVQTNVTVSLSYVLKDAKTGEVLWEDGEKMVYASGDAGGGLLGAIISAAVTRAAPDYMPLARKANAQAMAYPGPGFPAGPYRPEFRKDHPAPLPAQDASGAPAKQPASY
ncbi:MAG TPA: GNA1162 family protein [Anaeromyxobacter sp.]|nr:GNA1162 family protein [Anaeromyxobacter sp.]